MKDLQETFFEISEENQQGRCFIKKEDTAIPTVQNMLDNDWTIDDLYGGSRNDSDYFDAEDNLLPGELESEINEYIMIKYWNGNNWKTDFIDKMDVREIEAIVERDYEKDPSPLYYRIYEIILEDGEKIITSSSNCSGSISPYFEEITNEEE